MRLKITWGINDGYSGSARLQHLTIETTDYLEDDQPYEDMTQEEKYIFINERIADDFNDKIAYFCNNVEEVD